MQSRTDSLMEAIVNIIVGLIVSTIANHWVLPAVLHVQMSLGQNILIGVIFTVISLVRSYSLRRLFNGKSVWQAIRDFWALPWRKSPLKVRMVAAFTVLVLPILYPLAVIIWAARERIFADLNEDVMGQFRQLRSGRYIAW